MLTDVACPSCGHVGDFEECVYSDGVASPIIDIAEDGSIDYGLAYSFGECYDMWYQCACCGHKLKGVSCPEEFVEWCKEHSKDE